MLIAIAGIIFFVAVIAYIFYGTNVLNKKPPESGETPGKTPDIYDHEDWKSR
jgi:hypothetical protein